MDMTVLLEIVVQKLTIELKNSITPRNIKSNFVKVIQIELNLVTMVICALSHILRSKSQWIYYISLDAMNLIRAVSIQSQSISQLISTCSILKLFGAPIVMLLMLETPVSMRIIGKILGGNLTCLTTKESNALNGKLNISFKLTQMVAKMNTDVSIHMVGRNKSIIH